ncbi:MAG: hypothetical protein ACLQGP_34365 [Isosphaeraceae bacterium]
MSVHDLTNLLRLDLSREELILVSNALNEVCNGIDFTDDEFHTRIGGSREKALRVLRRIAATLGGDWV